MKRTSGSRIIALFSHLLAVTTAACSTPTGPAPANGSRAFNTNPAHQLEPAPHLGGPPTTFRHLAPVTGNKPWAVVLCKFPDKPDEPHSVQWYQDFVTHSAPKRDGLWDFWHDVSYGKMDLTGSQVFGWNTLPHNSTDSESRFALWSDCASTATNVNFGRFYGVLAILNAKKDSGAIGPGPVSAILNGNHGAWGIVVLDTGAQDVGWGAHEMGHAFGLNHNYDTGLSQCIVGAAPGEYCDQYDAMAYENGANTFQTSFGNSAPGLTAPNLLKLGWVPNLTVVRPNAPQDVGLAPLEQAPSIVQVPIGDSPQHYYTIEYRNPNLAYASGTTWGKLLPGPGVLIHEARANGLFYLVDTGGGPNFQLCQSFVGINNIRITVISMPSPWSASKAVVRIGYVGDGIPDPAPCNTQPSAGRVAVRSIEPDRQTVYLDWLLLKQASAEHRRSKTLKYPAPLEEAAIRAFWNNSHALDVY